MLRLFQFVACIKRLWNINYMHMQSFEEMIVILTDEECKHLNIFEKDSTIIKM